MHGHLNVKKVIWVCRRDVAQESFVLVSYTTSSVKYLQKFQSFWTRRFAIRSGITFLKTSIFKVDALFYVFRSLCMFLCIYYSWKFSLWPHQSQGKWLQYQWVRNLDGPQIGSGRCGEDFASSRDRYHSSGPVRFYNGNYQNIFTNKHG